MESRAIGGAGEIVANDIRTTASFAGVGLSGRLGVAGGLLLIALGGAFAAIDSGLRRIQSDFERIVNVAQPMAEAAFEMEINTLGAGLGVVNYLHRPPA